jgi:hypothetical protein
VSWHPKPLNFLHHGKLFQGITKNIYIYNKILDNLFKKWLSWISCRKSQTRCEAGTESHGSRRDRRVAWRRGNAAFLFLEIVGLVTPVKLQIYRKGVMHGKRGNFSIVLIGLVFGHIPEACGGR